MAKTDFIIPWVDGSDPVWQASFNRYAPQNAHIDDARKERFRDWGLLRYWFRGVERFAPWVRTVHFVTCGQLPDWLNTDAPKLHCVRHEDYIPAEYLPVFNINPIELNLHRIEGLSEQFVYFNDDTFILRPLPEERFFQNGLPCDMAVCNLLTPVREGVMTHVMANNMGIINDHFDKHTQLKRYWRKWLNPLYGSQQLRTLLLWQWPQFSNLYEHHQPNAYLKSTFEEIWELYGEQLLETSMTRFRSISNCSQWLMRDWRMVKGEFIPVNVTKDSFSGILGKDDIKKFTSMITGQRKSLLCINDGDLAPQEAAGIYDALHKAFETILPDKSSFEK